MNPKQAIVKQRQKSRPKVYVYLWNKLQQETQNMNKFQANGTKLI